MIEVIQRQAVFICAERLVQHPMHRRPANGDFDYHQRFRPAPVIVAVMPHDDMK
jgi:hypothetical protein